jgi:hypothetical protein
MTVVWKLGQREPIRPSCVAEELAGHILLPEAEALAEDQELPVDFASFRDTLFEDVDFEFLYDETFDGIEGTELGEVRGITHLPFCHWPSGLSDLAHQRVPRIPRCIPMRNSLKAVRPTYRLREHHGEEQSD